MVEMLADMVVPDEVGLVGAGKIFLATFAITLGLGVAFYSFGRIKYIWLEWRRQRLLRDDLFAQQEVRYQMLSEFEEPPEAVNWQRAMAAAAVPALWTSLPLSAAAIDRDGWMWIVLFAWLAATYAYRLWRYVNDPEDLRDPLFGELAASFTSIGDVTVPREAVIGFIAAIVLVGSVVALAILAF